MPLLAVNHHYFREQVPGKAIYPVSVERMKVNINSLRNHGWVLGTQKHILQYCEGNLADKVCVITFDDGLKEQMSCLRLLDTLDAGALFFVSTAPLVNQRVLDVHKMHMVRTALSDEEVASRLDKRFAFSKYKFDPSIIAVQYQYDVEINQKVKYF